MNTMEKAFAPQKSQGETTDLTGVSIPSDRLHSPNSASIDLFNEISKSMSETPQRLRNILQRSLRALLVRGKRYKGETGNDIRSEIDGTTAVENGEPIYEAHMGNEPNSSQPLPVVSRCTDAGSKPRKIFIPSPAVDRGINRVWDAGGYLQRQNQHGGGTMQLSEAADFMDLDDPFACNMVGSPCVVKNLDSVLRPTHQCTNKVVEARRRLRRPVKRPQSAGRPWSAGRRPGSASSNSGLSKTLRKVELRIGGPAQAATLCGAGLHPQTPKQSPTPRLTQSRPSSPRKCSAFISTNLSADSQVNVITTSPSGLSTAQQRINLRSSKVASHRSSARIVTFSDQPQRERVTSSSHSTSSPLRPATPMRRLAHKSLSPRTFPAARPSRINQNSFALKQFIPLVIP